MAQVNEAIAEEVEKSKHDAEIAAGLSGDAEVVSARGDTVSIVDSASQSALSTESDLTPRTSPTEASSTTSAPDLDEYTKKLDELAQSQQYEQIPAVFEAMLRNGIERPTQLAYRALLSSAIRLTPGKHQQVPRALEVYTDMLRRRVTPDADTYAELLNVLTSRALDASTTSRELERKRARYQGSENGFLFKSNELEHAILSEDESSNIALKIFKSAPSSVSLSSQTYAQLIQACAKRSQIIEMLHVYEDMESKNIVPQASIFPTMITAFASQGDLHNVVECYDEYKALAVANNAGLNDINRVDNEVYAALVKAYGTCQRSEGGQRFLRQVEAGEPSESKRQALRDTISLEALLPLDLDAGNFRHLSEVTKQLSGPAFARAMVLISSTAADQDNVQESTQAFNALVATGADLTEPAMAILAMYVRNGNVDAAEPYWRLLETSPASVELIEPTVVRAVALVGVGQAARGLRQSRIMFARVLESFRAAPAAKREIADRIEDAIEVLSRSVYNGPRPIQIEATIELLRIMATNGGLVAPFAEDLVAGIGAEQIAQLTPADVDLLTQVQCRMILDESTADIAGPARFGCLLENIVSRAMLPDVATENIIEKTLINLDNSDLSRLWNGYRYPATPAFSPAGFQQPSYAPSGHLPVQPVQPLFDESFDPYAARTDNKGSVSITDMLEKAHGRPATILNEALTKFRNMRRVGRHPRFFAYSKLINAAAKDNQLDTAHEVLEMAKQDVPFLPQYRVVRYGWVSILDSMLAACLMTGRRDLAARYHQDLLDMSAVPSANTYGLYITTLKENTKTFDEASEAVQIFLRSKAEGVEPTSFLYNALIGKLGKARRIDDCLFYFAEMRNLGIRPTSVTYGTIVNALCRVSDEKFAEEIFEEMESCANYKPRPAPYHSLMQYFLTTKRDRSKVLSYYERMRSRGIEPTMHTFKLLIDAHATLEPIDMAAAESVLQQMHDAGEQPDAVHFASLIHAKGCVSHDMAGARAMFDGIIADNKIRMQPCVYQAMFESLVANRQMEESDSLLADMRKRHVGMTPYITNALIHGWAKENNLEKAREAFNRIDGTKREPSTYEAMVRAHMAVEDREGAKTVVREALSRGYPSAVAGKIAELVGGGRV